MGRPDKAARAAIAQRRPDAIDLRLAGVDWLTVGRKLAAGGKTALRQLSKAELYQQATEQNVAGRSKMSRWSWSTCSAARGVAVRRAPPDLPDPLPRP
ncbi:hypothetical protein [Streptomyces sp. NPDC047009]|uniref:hypothetical protein n=1 Tax=Streptomyces sp. NPDC047009 TaxID=3154496 RepID=UPI0033C177B3